MGKRFENWLSKTGSSATRKAWRIRWNRFTLWVTTSNNPLTGSNYMSCKPGEVDDLIRKDFEEMPSHLFQDKYGDMLTKYLISFLNEPDNTTLAFISTVRAFFSSECTSIKIQRSKIPKTQMAMNEHRFALEEFKQMWYVGDLEDKARLSVAVSLGWSVGDFVNLETRFIREVIQNRDEDGFAAFDYQTHKTRARVRGILTPGAVQDLEKSLREIPEEQEYLWTTRTKEGMNKWLKALYRKAGIKESGQVRFHLIRKYTYDVAVSQIGPYEAKLLVGKEVPLSDATCLQNLPDRLLERYKKFAYPFLNLNGEGQARANEKVEDLIEKLEKQGQALDFLQGENLELKSKMKEVESLRRQVETLEKEKEKNDATRTRVESLELEIRRVLALSDQFDEIERARKDKKKAEEQAVKEG